MKILVTGVAGFIGFHLAKKLISLGHEVVGLDNLNEYYDKALKFDRLKELGLKRPEEISEDCSAEAPDFRFYRIDVAHKGQVFRLFENENIELVCHLAAQAGVRYSLENPDIYIQSNVQGFLNILEAARTFGPQEIMYASSSSVYGANKKYPFSETDPVNSPVSLYASTKRTNELMAHTYESLYHLKTVGMRFFTVFGPWGRPDMALYKFTRLILEGRPIPVYNFGNLKRDFTYIDDVVEAIVTIMKDPKRLWSGENSPGSSIYNIGRGQPVGLMEFIDALEIATGKKAKKEMLPMQAGDVFETYADGRKLANDFHFSPQCSIQQGVKYFVEWYRDYYKT